MWTGSSPFDRRQGRKGRGREGTVDAAPRPTAVEVTMVRRLAYTLSSGESTTEFPAVGVIEPEEF